MNKPYLFIGVALLIITIATPFMSGCYYQFYGVRRDASSLLYPQTDEEYIRGKYEFKSILFKSTDGNLVVDVLHPQFYGVDSTVYHSRIHFGVVDEDVGVPTVETISFALFDGEGMRVKPASPGSYRISYLRSSLVREMSAGN